MNKEDLIKEIPNVEDYVNFVEINEKGPLLGGAFKKDGKCFIFHGYDMSEPARPRISWMEVNVSYAPQWNDEWGSLHHAQILKPDPGFLPRNRSSRTNWAEEGN